MSGLGYQLLGFQRPSYQGRGDFRGRGILLAMVETLLVRWVVPVRQWRFNL